MPDKIDLPPAIELAVMVRASDIDQVADDYGCTTHTIYKWLRAGGFGTDGQEKAPPESRFPNIFQFGFDARPWVDDALCMQTDPEAFFPEKGGSTKEAKSVCARCTVAAECLDWALDHNERYGIWGGLSERERRRITRHQESA